MTDPVPYTAEELEAAIGNLSCFDALPLPYAVEMRGSDCLRLAATLRDYQRVLAENAALSDELRAVAWECGTDNTQYPDLYRGAATLVRSQLNALETEVAALRADALRWRAVRDDLALDLMTNPVQGVMRAFWRIEGNNYDYYREPVPTTVDEAADMIAARSGGEEKHD